MDATKLILLGSARGFAVGCCSPVHSCRPPGRILRRPLTLQFRHTAGWTNGPRPNRQRKAAVVKPAADSGQQTQKRRRLEEGADTSCCREGSHLFLVISAQGPPPGEVGPFESGGVSDPEVLRAGTRCSTLGPKARP